MARESQDDPRRSADTSAIYENILANIACAVISLDTRGVITTFNAAASEIVGLSEEAVVGRTFAEVFLPMEDVEEFTEIILDAVYDASVGHQRVVEATFAGRKWSLSMVTSYLREVRGGETVGLGLVAMFSDISELKELREKEFRLAKEVEAKHNELRDAYLNLEDNNQKLNAALKKVQAVRVGVTVFVLVLFLAIGLYTWNANPQIAAVTFPPPAAASAAVQGELPTLVVTPQRLSSSITVTGKLAPRREIDVTSPITGKVAAVHFQYGEQVAAGHPLVDLDVSEVRIEYREAQAAYIKARERFKEFEDWSNHVEVARARRVVSRGRIALESRRNRLEETTFLLERGVIPASEPEAAEREYHNQQLDVQSAEQDLQVILAKGAADGQVAQLELDNARARLEELEETIRKAVVHAPVAGVILHPKPSAGGGASEEEHRLARGTSIQQGERLLTIGDLSGLSVVGTVDEVDIARVHPGEPARIVGDAFPDIELSGTITHVSSQASSGGVNRELPSFEVTATVEDLIEEQRRLLRLGMSANLEVIVYDKPDALLVPIGAVDMQEGHPRLRIKDKDSGAVRYVRVETGLTTVDTVEIVDGIRAGDNIVLAER